MLSVWAVEVNAERYCSDIKNSHISHFLNQSCRHRLIIRIPSCARHAGGHNLWTAGLQIMNQACCEQRARNTYMELVVPLTGRWDISRLISEDPWKSTLKISSERKIGTICVSCRIYGKAWAGLWVHHWIDGPDSQCAVYAMLEPYDL